MPGVRRTAVYVTKGLLLGICLAALVFALRPSSDRAGRRYLSGEDVDGTVRWRWVDFSWASGAVWIDRRSFSTQRGETGDLSDHVHAMLADERGWRPVPDGALLPGPWQSSNWRGVGRFGIWRWDDHYSYHSRAWGLAAPLWGIALAAGIWPIGGAVHSIVGRLRRWRRERRHLCPACGYDWRATPDSTGVTLDRCPECGHETDTRQEVTTPA